jgi:hypothetical protein
MSPTEAQSASERRGLGAGDRQPQPLGCDRHGGAGEGDQFGAPQRAGEPNEQQGTIGQVDEPVGAAAGQDAAAARLCAAHQDAKCCHSAR